MRDWWTAGGTRDGRAGDSRPPGLFNSPLPHSQPCPPVAPPRRARPALPRTSVAQDGGTTIILAAMGGHDKVVERLVAAKAEVNASGQVGDEARGDTRRAQAGLRGGGGWRA